MHHAHATATTTTSGFDDDRVTNAFGDFDNLARVIRQGPVGAGHARYTSFFHGVLGRNLVAHQADGFGTRADEHETALFHTFGKICILGQKAIARMYRLCIRDFSRTDNSWDV